MWGQAIMNVTFNRHYQCHLLLNPHCKNDHGHQQGSSLYLVSSERDKRRVWSDSDVQERVRDERPQQVQLTTPSSKSAPHVPKSHVSTRKLCS